MTAVDDSNGSLLGLVVGRCAALLVEQAEGLALAVEADVAETSMVISMAE